IPALGALAIEPLYVLVDTAIVGRLGTVPLGGLALATTVLTTLLWAFNFLSFGTTARVAFLTRRQQPADAAGGAPQGPRLCVLVANLINVVLELVLVYGFDTGIAGSAWGTVVAQWLAAAWFILLCARRVAATGAPLGPRRREMAKLVVIGRHLFFRTGALLAT